MKTKIPNIQDCISHYIHSHPIHSIQPSECKRVSFIHRDILGNNTRKRYFYEFIDSNGVPFCRYTISELRYLYKVECLNKSTQ